VNEITQTAAQAILTICWAINEMIINEQIGSQYQFSILIFTNSLRA